MMFPISPIWAFSWSVRVVAIHFHLPFPWHKHLHPCSSRKAKSSLLVLLPTISFNVEKRCIPMESNGIAWNTINSNGNLPSVFTVSFLHTGQHTLSFCRWADSAGLSWRGCGDTASTTWPHAGCQRCWESSLIYALIAASAQADQLEVVLTNDVRMRGSSHLSKAGHNSHKLQKTLELPLLMCVVHPWHSLPVGSACTMISTEPVFLEKLWPKFTEGQEKPSLQLLYQNLSDYQISSECWTRERNSCLNKRCILVWRITSLSAADPASWTTEGKRGIQAELQTDIKVYLIAGWVRAIGKPWILGKAPWCATPCNKTAASKGCFRRWAAFSLAIPATQPCSDERHGIRW